MHALAIQELDRASRLFSYCTTIMDCFASFRFSFYTILLLIGTLGNIVVYNYVISMTCLFSGNYKEAEEIFLQIQSEKIQVGT